MIQGQFHTQLSSGDVLDLKEMNHNIEWLKKGTLRELIMNFTKKSSEHQSLFVAVEKRWDR